MHFHTRNTAKKVEVRSCRLRRCRTGRRWTQLSGVSASRESVQETGSCWAHKGSSRWISRSHGAPSYDASSEASGISTLACVEMLSTSMIPSKLFSATTTVMSDSLPHSSWPSPAMPMRCTGLQIPATPIGEKSLDPPRSLLSCFHTPLILLRVTKVSVIVIEPQQRVLPTSRKGYITWTGPISCEFARGNDCGRREQYIWLVQAALSYDASLRSKHIRPSEPSGPHGNNCSWSSHCKRTSADILHHLMHKGRSLGRISMHCFRWPLVWLDWLSNRGSAGEVLILSSLVHNTNACFKPLETFKYYLRCWDGSNERDRCLTRHSHLPINSFPQDESHKHSGIAA